jgi:hypothetical protein
MKKDTKKTAKGGRDRQTQPEERDRFVEDVPPCLLNDPLVFNGKKSDGIPVAVPEPDPMTT